MNLDFISISILFCKDIGMSLLFKGLRTTGFEKTWQHVVWEIMELTKFDFTLANLLALGRVDKSSRH